jgi:hypothetical protein
MAVQALLAFGQASTTPYVLQLAFATWQQSWQTLALFSPHAKHCLHGLHMKGSEIMVCPAC